MLKTVGNPSNRYGDQTIIDGNLVVGTSGKGIDFSANPNAPGMTSELLDDYEEGTWTPILTSSDNNVVVASYQFQNGRYTKIGRFICATFKLATSNVTSVGTGEARIGGLPFTVNASDPAAGATGYVANFVAGFNPSSVQTVLSTSEMTMMYSPSTGGGQTPIQTTNLTSGAVAFGNYIIGTICYEVD